MSNTDDHFRRLIETGDVAGVRRALDLEPALANRTIRWHPNQHNESDPLHYASDCVLTGATSLAAEKVSAVLIAAGADLESTTIYQSRPIHWAAWIGSATTVQQLIARGAQIEVKDSEFGAMPLFWAVHGYGPDGPEPKKDQVEAARLLLAAGATARTFNKQGRSALERAKTCKSQDMYGLLKQHV